jgi:CDP-diacylglycerol--serine O-phosphatidyltransferase
MPSQGLKQGLNPKAVPIRRLIPNLITLLGLCAGLTAIRMAIESRFELAIAFIVAAAVFDALDGRMARLLKANSRFGAELDSLADFVNFGVAPVVTLYLWGLKGAPSLGWIAVLIFALAAALRLARFNVAAEAEVGTVPDWRRGYFTGVPTPAGALLLLLPLYLEGLGLPKANFPAILIAAYALGIAALMISRLPTFSGKLKHARIERQNVPAIIVSAAFAAAMLATYPYLVLTLGAAAYAVSLPLANARYKRRSEAIATTEGMSPVSDVAARLSLIDGGQSGRDGKPVRPTPKDAS